MIQTLIQNWWLVALCGILDAALSLLHFMMEDTEGSLMPRKFAVRTTVVILGRVMAATGACTVAAALWNSRKGQPWLLALNGVALFAVGLIGIFWSRGRLGFLPVALLFVVMAVSIGVLALATARTLERHVADEWFLIVAGAISIAFALAFLAGGLGWIRFVQPAYWVFMASYFAFSAICMLALGLRLNYLRTAIHRMAARSLPS